MSVVLDRDDPIFSGPVHVRFEEKKGRGSGNVGEEIVVVVRVLRGKCVVSTDILAYIYTVLLLL